MIDYKLVGSLLEAFILSFVILKYYEVSNALKYGLATVFSVTMSLYTYFFLQEVGIILFPMIVFVCGVALCKQSFKSVLKLTLKLFIIMLICHGVSTLLYLLLFGFNTSTIMLLTITAFSLEFYTMYDILIKGESKIMSVILFFLGDKKKKSLKEFKKSKETK